MRVSSPWRLAAVLAVLAACSSDGGPTDPDGNFTIALSPAAVSVAQGASGQTTVTLTRTDGFAGAVNFDVEGAPTGVTGSVAGSGTTAVSTGVVTIVVGSVVAPGVYNLTLKGSATGRTAQTTALALTVTSAGAFTLGLASSTMTLAQGGSGNASLVLTRTGAFTGAVAMASVTGAPTGVTVSFVPASFATGVTTSALTVAVAGSVVAGTYPLVITGTSAGVPNATTTLTLTVAAPVGSFTLSATPAALGMTPGGATSVSTITVTRVGAFAGAVTLALTSTAQGITTTFAPATIAAGATTSVATFTVPAAAATGAYPLVVTGTGPGVANATATVTVTVSPAPTGSFAMQFAPATATLQAGTGTTSTLTLTRTAPFNGGVGLTVAGLPANATMTFAPTSLSAAQTTTVATITTTAAVQAGSYPLVITGLGTGVAVPPSATADYTLVVTGVPPVGAIGFQFCDPASAPVWFAFQDQAGVGGWNPVPVGANTTYSFDLVSSSGGVAWVEPDGSGGFHTTVYYSTKANLESLAASNCTETSNNKTVTGSVLGLTALDNAFIGLGTSGTVANFGLPNFTLRNVPPGSRSLIASRATLNIGTGTYTSNKVVIRRGQSIANGGVIPAINFDTEGFDPAVQNLVILNVLGWAASSSLQFFTDNGGSAGTLVAGGSTIVFPAIPNGVAGDFHYVTATATPTILDASQFRSAGKIFAAAADQTVTMGAIFGTPTLVNAGGAAYARLQVTGPVQADYDNLLALSYSQPGKSASVMVTGAPFVLGGGGTYTLAFPNFSGLAGWLDSWMPANVVQTTWNLFGQGWTGTGILNGPVVEGTVVLTAGTGGTVTP